MSSPGTAPGRRQGTADDRRAPCAPRAAGRSTLAALPRMCSQVVVVGLPHDLRGDAGDHRPGRELLALGDDGAGGDDRAGADVRAVHHHAAHADEHLVLDVRAVQHHAVADGDVAADHQREAGIGVQRAAVLDVGALADLDRLGVGAGDGAVPDARARGPIVTAPTTTAVGATKASSSIFGAPKGSSAM